MTDKNHASYAAEDEIEIDLRQLITVLKKWSKLIITMTLLCTFTAGVLSYFFLTPIYQAQTLLMVTQATDKLQAAPQQGDSLERVVSSMSSTPVWTMSTYLGQLKSEALMKRIIAELRLIDYTPDMLSGMINASVVKDSNLIEVKVTSSDPRLAARIANTLSSEYLKLMTEKNQEQLNRSVTFLEKQKEFTDLELGKATEHLKAFQSEPRGVALLQTEFESKSKDLANYSSRLKMVEIEIHQLTYGVNSLQNELEVTPQMLYIDRWHESTGSAKQVQEINPVYISLSQQLSQKKSALAEKQGEASAIQYIVSSLSIELNYLQTELARKRIEEDRLVREVERLKKTSETLATKGTETQIAKSRDLGDTSVVVVSEASTPINPIKPNKMLNMAIAMVLGLMVFTLLAFILEYLDNTLKTPEDIEKELQLPVLGLIPKMDEHNIRQL